jgi:hypothetical protein
MEIYKIPGFSIAVIDDYKIAWAKAYGVTDAHSNTPVTYKDAVSSWVDQQTCGRNRRFIPGRTRQIVTR